MHRLIVVALVVTAACSAPSAPRAPERREVVVVVPPPPDAVPPPVVVDAAVAIEPVASAAAVVVVADAPLALPPALPPPAPPTPASRACRTTASDDVDHEREREAAATDAALRKAGYIPLEVTADQDDYGRPLSPADPPGTHAHGGPGGHWLVIGKVSGCGGEAPTVAMTKQHEVFVVAAKVVAANVRTVTECTNSCAGVCGHYQPPRAVSVAVPADAVAIERRTIRVPLGVRVAFRYAHRSDCRVP